MRSLILVCSSLCSACSLLQAPSRSRLQSLRHNRRQGNVSRVFFGDCSVFVFLAEANACVNLTSPSAVQNFVVKADDLEKNAELGRGAYGVVDKMKHVPSGVIMAVKVGWQVTARAT